MRKKRLLWVLGACLAILSLTAGSALADPVPPLPPDRPLAGVGSSLSQDVMNGYANGTSFSAPPYPGIKDGAGNFVVSSFNGVTAFGGSEFITTHPGIPACTHIGRPSTSGGGISSLSNDTNGCIQFARSNAQPPVSHPGLTFIPFATDVLTYATLSQSIVPKNLTKDQLKFIYTRDVSGPRSPCIFQPLLPSVFLGTERAWLEFLGIPRGSGELLGNCAKNSIRDNDGTAITNASQLLPYSYAQFTLQTTNPAFPDQSGAARLRAINGIAPSSVNAPGRFPLYNVVRTGDLGNPAIATTFVGAGSAICSHPEVIDAYALSVNPACGSRID